MFVQLNLKFNSLWVLSAPFVYLRTCRTQRLTVEYWIEGHWVFNIYCFVKQIKSGSKSKTHQKKRKLCVVSCPFSIRNVLLRTPREFFFENPRLLDLGRQTGPKNVFFEIKELDVSQIIWWRWLLQFTNLYWNHSLCNF